MKYCLDANVIIRAIIEDNPEQSSASLRLLQEMREGRKGAIIYECVILDIIYVLTSSRLYNLSHREVRDKLYPILSISTITNPDKDIFLDALELFADHKHLDITDALIICHMQKEHIGGVYTYDSDFERIPGIQKEEPH